VAASVRRAFTIYELLLAFLIVGLTMLPLIGLFSAASDQAHLAADHTVTLGLSSQVAEELRVASWENRHFPDDVDREPQFGGADSIVEGRGRFFAAIEDTAQPAGRIKAGEDAGIVPELGPLYREVQNHRLTVEAKPYSAPDTGKLFDVSISFEWPDVKERVRETRFDVRLPHHMIAAMPPTSNRAEADRLIAVAFYGQNPGGTLAQLAQTRGADLEVLRALGDVSIISPALEATEEDHQKELAVREDEVKAAHGDYERARALSLLGRQLETRACMRMRVAEFLGPALATLAARFKPAALGQPPPPPEAYVEATRLIAYLPIDLDWDVCDGITAYREAMALPRQAMPMRVRNGILERGVSLAELLALTTGPDDLVLARTMLEDMVAFNDGRNPNLAAFARSELDRCRDVASLRATYEPATRLPGWNAFVQSVVPAVTAVLLSGQDPAQATSAAAPPPRSKPGSRARGNL